MRVVAPRAQLLRNVSADRRDAGAAGVELPADEHRPRVPHNGRRVRLHGHLGAADYGPVEARAHPLPPALNHLHPRVPVRRHHSAREPSGRLRYYLLIQYILQGATF